MSRPLAFVDVESRSAIDLPARGIDAYLADASTVPVSIVALTAEACHVWVNSSLYDGQTRMPLGELDIPDRYGDVPPVRIYFTPGPPRVLADLAASHDWVGHNAAGFDEPFCKAKLSLHPRWIDTLPLAKQAGLPGKLDDIGHALLGVGKHEGGKILRRFYDASKPAPFHLLWPLVGYNVCDCLITRALYRDVESFVPDQERRLIALHQTVNRRGVGFDESLHARLLDVAHHAREHAGEQIEDLTAGRLKRTDLRSVPKMKAWLAENGFRVENMRRETVNRLLGEPDLFFEGDEETGVTLEAVMPVVPRVLRLRTAATRNTGAKLDRMRGRAGGDGRLRDLLVYYGAHTGRFSSRVVQLHNMYRGVPKCDVKGLLAGLGDDTPRNYALLRDEAARLRLIPGLGWVAVDDVIATLLRYVLVPTPGRWFGIVDYAAIEARCLAWMAGEESLLDAYRRDRDVYCDFGAKLFGRPITKTDESQRQVSKVVVLGAGYGMSGEKMAIYCANNGVDLHAAGVTAEQCIQTYRQTYPRIPELWYAMADAVKDAVREPGAVTEAGRCAYQMWEGHLICQLPSGRELVYRNARLEDVLMRWGETRPAVVYDHPHGFRKSLWHGLLVENADQGTCRDLLVAAMLEIDRPGCEVVLHVHDEVVCELDEPGKLAVMEAAMRKGQPWSDGFPVGVEGYASRRYGKVAID